MLICFEATSHKVFITTPIEQHIKSNAAASAEAGNLGPPICTTMIGVNVGKTMPFAPSPSHHPK